MGKKKGLQKSRYLEARAKASKRKGRNEEKYQLSTKLACSIGTLLKCNMEKGKRKKDHFQGKEGQRKGCLDFDQKLLTSVCTSGWPFQLSVRKRNLEWYLTVIMWTPYQLKNSQQQNTGNTQKEGRHPLLCYVPEKMRLSEKLIPTKVSCKMDDVWMRITFSSIFLFHS